MTTPPYTAQMPKAGLPSLCSGQAHLTLGLGNKNWKVKADFLSGVPKAGLPSLCSGQAHQSAEGRTRTGTGLPTTPSRWRVYQVPPLRQRQTL